MAWLRLAAVGHWEQMASHLFTRRSTEPRLSAFFEGPAALHLTAGQRLGGRDLLLPNAIIILQSPVLANLSVLRVVLLLTFILLSSPISTSVSTLLGT